MTKKKPVRKQAEEESEYDNSNTGVLFQNKKRKNEDHPHMRGSFTDSEGNEFWLSAWSKEHDKYGKYLSIVASPKEDEPTMKKGTRHSSKDVDDLPF